MDDAALMGRIDSTYTPQFAHAFRGYLLMAAGQYVSGAHMLNIVDPAVSVEAQRRINEAAQVGAFGFDAVTGRAYLEARVRYHNDQHAQQILNEAAQYGKLGFNDETGRAYLEARIRHGDQDVQKRF